MASETAKRLTRKEQLTLLISCVALFVSFVGVYFSHFYVSQKLEVVVLEADLAGGELVYQVAIINPGNRKALIKDASLIVNPGDNILHASNPLRSVKRSTSLPATVEKDSVTLLTWEGPFLFADLYERGVEPEQGSGLETFDGEPTKKVVITASFESMNFRGDIYHANTGVMSAHITTSNVAGWQHDGAKRSLFVKR
jgi:hypothetical protein